MGAGRAASQVCYPDINVCDFPLVAHSLGECEGVSFRNKVKVAMYMDENAVAAYVISACDARVHAFHTRTRFRLGALQVTTMQRYKRGKCATLVSLCHHSTHQTCGAGFRLWLLDFVFGNRIASG